jgi:hypothetical protein
MTEYEARDFLKPLPIGSHTIYFKGELRSITARGSNQTLRGPIWMGLPDTYHIIVLESKANTRR